MPATSREPVRTCVGCREEAGKRGLIRLVRTPEGVVGPDPTGRATGRGIITYSVMKAHELARELNISPRELVNYLQQNRLTRNPSAPLPPQAIEAARHQFGRTATAVRAPEVNGDRKVVLPPTMSV